MNFPASTGWAALVDLVFVTGIVALEALYLRMIFEINRSLPEDRRLKYFRWSWETPKVEALHKELFPDSKLRLASNIILVIWFPFGIIGFLRFRQALDAW